MNLVARLRLGCALLVAVSALGSIRPGAAQAPATMTIGLTTRSATDWGLEVAQKLGFFAANGLTVQAVVIGSSAGVAQQLAAGSVDIGSVSTTQVVEAILGGAPIVEIFKNVSTTPYTLIGRKGLNTPDKLRGKTIMIGGPNDITRVFMDKILASYGFKPDDYTYTYAGAPAERYAALVNGGIDATVLLPPVTFRATDEGYPVIDEVPKYFPHFPTSGYAVQSAWAKAHRDTLLAFLRGFQTGVRWLYNPANKARALQILEDADNVTPDVAAKTYDVYVSRGRLLPPSGRFDADDFAQVVDTLVRTKQIPAPAPPPARFYDNTYIDAAMASLR
jgi:ABC-type nitrate/sulfonate/bicarbonate transport system substrate-binding protein